MYVAGIQSILDQSGEIVHILPPTSTTCRSESSRTAPARSRAAITVTKVHVTIVHVPIRKIHCERRFGCDKVNPKQPPEAVCPGHLPPPPTVMMSTFQATVQNRQLPEGMTAPDRPGTRASLKGSSGKVSSRSTRASIPHLWTASCCCCVCFFNLC